MKFLRKEIPAEMSQVVNLIETPRLIELRWYIKRANFCSPPDHTTALNFMKHCDRQIEFAELVFDCAGSPFRKFIRSS